MSRRAVGWTGVIVIAITVLSMASVVLFTGWDQADQVASVLGAVAGTAGLMAAIYGLSASGDTDTADPAPVTNETDVAGEVTGQIIQTGHIYGEVVIGDRGPEERNNGRHGN